MLIDTLHIKIMSEFRTQLILSNVTQGIMKRIEVALAKNLNKDDYVLNLNQNIVIINNNEILLNTKKIIKSVDEKINISEKELKDKYRYVFYLENLDCANCAMKVERICKRSIPNELVVVDFATLKIVVETTVKYDTFELRMQIQEYAETVDPRIEVKEKLNTKKATDTEFKISSKKKKQFILGCSIFIVFFILKNVLKFVYDFDSVWTYVIIYAGYLPAYIILAKDILYGAYKNIRSGRVFDEKFLMSLATIMALIAQLYDEALFVIIFYQIGELCQQYAVNYSRKSIAGLVDIKPQKAIIEINGKKQEMNPESVVIGDILYINSGDKIALDGVVIDGRASLNCQALTGESKPVECKNGTEVMSGSICIEGTIKVKVTKTYENSMVSKILNMVENASILKSKSENFISKFAKYYTPIVVGLAILIAILLPLFASGYQLSWKGGYQDSLRVAMIFLVVSCPCALVISIPLGFFGGIGAASKEGILVKGSNYLEAMNNVDVVVFDKTGTLTKGNFAVKKIVTISEYTEDEILRYAAFAEATSNHVIAKSIISAYGKVVDTSVVKSELISDKRGIIANVEDKVVAIGRKMFLDTLKIKTTTIKDDDDVLIIAINEKAVGYIVIEDEIRDEAKITIKELHKRGVKKIIMITGDSQIVAEKVADELGIDEFYSNMSPLDKVATLQEIKKKYSKQKIAFVGDGINDAPVISIADIGIAMGGFGSDATTQIADVVLINDDLTKLYTLIDVSQRTKDIVVENIAIALMVKFIFLAISPLNINLIINTFLVYAAIFADVGVSLIAIVNSLRILKVGKKK